MGAHTSRRSLLGALALAPAVAVTTCVPAPAAAVDRSAWVKLVEAHGAAERARLAFSANVYDPALARGEPIDDIDDEWNRLADAETSAWGEALLAPAPDLAAVQWKLTQLFGDEARSDGDHISSWHRRYTDAIRADVTRLGGLA